VAGRAGSGSTCGSGWAISGCSDEHASPARHRPERRPHPASFGAGAFFTIAGIVFLLEQLDVVRLDAGVLWPLLLIGLGVAVAAEEAWLLDDAGLGQVRIFASGGLDEYAIAGLVARGAPVDAFGVGTKMGTSADAPYLDTAYKMVAYAGRPVMKLSAGKVTSPAPKQVFRGAAADGDLVGLRDEPPPPGRAPLLVPVMSDGRRAGPGGDLAVASDWFEADLAWLPEAARALHDPRPVPVGLTGRLGRLRDQVRATLTARDWTPGRGWPLGLVIAALDAAALVAWSRYGALSTASRMVPNMAVHLRKCSPRACVR